MSLAATSAAAAMGSFHVSVTGNLCALPPVDPCPAASCPLPSFPCTAYVQVQEGVQRDVPSRMLLASVALLLCCRPCVARTICKGMNVCTVMAPMQHQALCRAWVSLFSTTPYQVLLHLQGGGEERGGQYIERTTSSAILSDTSSRAGLTCQACW
jgi:hypothetical protein